MSNTKHSIEKEVDGYSIGLASPELIRAQSKGEVKNAFTIDKHGGRYDKYAANGLLCPAIFGPLKDYRCICEKPPKPRKKGEPCKECNVVFTKASVRRSWFGHIELAAPVLNPLFADTVAALLGIPEGSRRLKERDSEAQTAVSTKYRVTDPLETTLKKGELLTEKEFREAEEEYGKHAFEFDFPRKQGRSGLFQIVYCKQYVVITAGNATLRGVRVKRLQFLTPRDHNTLTRKFGKTGFESETGALAIKRLLKELDLTLLEEELFAKLADPKTPKGARKKISDRLAVVRTALAQSQSEDHPNKPEWMLLNVLPVLPADLRQLSETEPSSLLSFARTQYEQRELIRKGFREAASRPLAKRIAKLASKGSPIALSPRNVLPLFGWGVIGCSKEDGIKLEAEKLPHRLREIAKRQYEDTLAKTARCIAGAVRLGLWQKHYLSDLPAFVATSERHLRALASKLSQRPLPLHSFAEFLGTRIQETYKSRKLSTESGKIDCALIAQVREHAIQFVSNVCLDEISSRGLVEALENVLLREAYSAEVAECLRGEYDQKKKSDLIQWITHAANEAAFFQGIITDGVALEFVSSNLAPFLKHQSCVDSSVADEIRTWLHELTADAFKDQVADWSSDASLCESIRAILEATSNMDQVNSVALPYRKAMKYRRQLSGNERPQEYNRRELRAGANLEPRSRELNDRYGRIIEANASLNRLKKQGSPPDVALRHAMCRLQKAVDGMMERSSDDEPASLADRLAGKKGRFRDSLLGKRVDCSARATIIVGPTLRLNECGLPMQIALELYRPFVLQRLASEKRLRIDGKKQGKAKRFIRELEDLLSDRSTYRVTIYVPAGQLYLRAVDDEFRIIAGHETNCLTLEGTLSSLNRLFGRVENERSVVTLHPPEDKNTYGMPLSVTIEQRSTSTRHFALTSDETSIDAQDDTLPITGYARVELKPRHGAKLIVAAPSEPILPEDEKNTWRISGKGISVSNNQLAILVTLTLRVQHGTLEILTDRSTKHVSIWKNNDAEIQVSGTVSQLNRILEKKKGRGPILYRAAKRTKLDSPEVDVLHIIADDDLQTARNVALIKREGSFNPERLTVKTPWKSIRAHRTKPTLLFSDGFCFSKSSLPVDRPFHSEPHRLLQILEQVMREHHVILNRAPTLHRLGIQAFRPKLVSGKAIQLHPLACKGFGADFDGDTIAVHLPLSKEAEKEASERLLPEKNLFTPGDGSPNLALSQDAVLGLHFLTLDNPPRVLEETISSLMTKGLVEEGSAPALATLGAAIASQVGPGWKLTDDGSLAAVLLNDNYRRLAETLTEAQQELLLRFEKDQITPNELCNISCEVLDSLATSRLIISLRPVLFTTDWQITPLGTNVAQHLRAAACLNAETLQLSSEERSVLLQLASRTCLLCRLGNAPTLLYILSSLAEASRRYEYGEFSLHTPIAVRPPPDPCQPDPRQPFALTTVGRVKLNLFLEEVITCQPNAGSVSTLPFVNEPLGTEQLRDLTFRCFKQYGRSVTTRMLDELNRLGFQEATNSGLSIATSDLVVPREDKEALIRKADCDVAEYGEQHASGNMTRDELVNRRRAVWGRVKGALDELVVNELENSSSAASSSEPAYINPVHIMRHSGARGNKTQVTQLCGMRGLMQNATGEILTEPIRSNFKEGLKIHEFWVSTYGAVKGQADRSLNTAESGYLTRKLVDVAQNVVVTEEDCGSPDGFPRDVTFNAKKQRMEIGPTIIGRFAARDVVDPKNQSDIIVLRNGLITKELAERIDEKGIARVYIRSPLTCRTVHGVCRRCYGIDPATKSLVARGTAVGVVAGQSIGERATQLTMRTFHTGGVAETNDQNAVVPAKRKGKVTYVNSDQVVSDQNCGQVELGSNCRLQVRDNLGNIVEEHLVPRGATELPKAGDTVKKKQKLYTCNPHAYEIRARTEGRVEKLIDFDAKAECGGASTLPRILVTSPTSGPRTYYLPPNAEVMVHETQDVFPGTILAKVPFDVSEAKDITSGVKAMEQIFAASTQPRPVPLSKNTGRVSIHCPDVVHIQGDTKRTKTKIEASSSTLLLDEGDFVEKGAPIAESPSSLRAPFAGTIKLKLPRPDHVLVRTKRRGIQSYPLSYGDCAVKNGQQVRTGKVLIKAHDQPADPIVARHSGIVTVHDLLDDESEAQSISITGPRGGVRVQSLPRERRLLVKTGAEVLKGKTVLSDTRHVPAVKCAASGTVEIPRIQTLVVTASRGNKTEALEVPAGHRKLVRTGDKVRKGTLLTTRSDFCAAHAGTLRFLPSGQYQIAVQSLTDPEDVQQYAVSVTETLRVQDGDLVCTGDSFIDRTPNAHDMLRNFGPTACEQFIVRQVRKLLRAHGANVNDVHLEVVIAQMLGSVRITETRKANRTFFEGQELRRREFEKLTAGLPKRQIPQHEWVLSGISRAATRSESFLSAASFERTINVLSDSAFASRFDPCLGLKENVIRAKLIPAGTGLEYRESCNGRDMEALKTVFEIGHSSQPSSYTASDKES